MKLVKEQISYLIIQQLSRKVWYSITNSTYGQTSSYLWNLDRQIAGNQLANNILTQLKENMANIRIPYETN